MLAVRAGDRAAVDVLYRRYSPHALRFARSLVGSEHDARDLMQEAFTKTVCALTNGYGPNENFPGYLNTAVKSVAAQWWNRNSREVPVETSILEATQGSAEDPQLDMVLEAGGNAIVLAALQSLPVRWQRVLWYADVLQEPPRRIGPLMGIKPNAVSALARRARKGLREAYLARIIDEDGNEGRTEVLRGYEI